MKHKILLFFFFISYLINAQNQAFFDVKGNLITDEDISIREVFNMHFSEYKMSDTFFPDDDNDDYCIIYQSFSYRPLFLIANSETKKKTFGKWIKLFNDKHQFGDYNIDNNYMLKYEIEEAIEKKLTDSFFLKTIGKPNNSYQNSEGFKIYNYNGVDKSFDLIFKNGVVSDYRLYNEY